MRIIGSKFHDYYDTAMAHGMDKELVYMRNQSIRPINEKWGTIFSNSWNRFPSLGSMEYTIEPGVVLFCGKQSPYIRLIYNKDDIRTSAQTVHAYGINDVDEFVDKYCAKYTLDSYYGTNETGTNKIYKRSRAYNKRQKNREKFERFFNEIPFKVADVNEFHYIEKAPAIFIGEDRIKAIEGEGSKVIIINPRLADVGFYKIVDAFTAFQEISMFLGGVLGVGAPKMVAVSDEVRAHKHGMDKTSFRMPSPGDRKFRRRNQ